MDTDWNTGVEVELPLPSHRKSIGDDVSRLENGVMELLWHNGEVVLNKQKSSCKCHDDNDDDEETASWIHCPIDEAFEKEFCSNLIFSDEIAPPNPITSLPPPRLIIPSRNHSKKGPGESMSTIRGGSSHCGSNNQVEKSHGPRGRRFRLMQVSDKKKNIIISSQSKTTSTELQPITTSSTNDEDTSTSTKRKSRDHEMEDQSECQSDAPESAELATGNKVMSSQKSGTTRRSRVAQVHNLSERRRRDRINEKMKALQELIPHSNKSDKASMLDEAIEYMKSLQLQLQLMWNMGSTGMAARPPLMMHQYHPAAALLMQQYQYMMSSLMARPTPTPTLPQIQNHLMRFLSPPNNNINQPTQNHHSNSSTMFNHHQMQNPNFTHDHNQYANNYNINTFHPMQNTSSTSHPVNMFNLGAQQNHHHHVLAQPNIGNNMDLPS